MRAVVIGVGKLGTYHAQKLLALQAEGVSLAAVVDTNSQACQEKFPHIPYYNSVNALLAADSNFDVAIVATPTIYHAEIGLQLIELGKHLLIEKPLAATPEEARVLVEAAEAKKVWLAVGKVERHRAQKVLKDVEQPAFIECHRLSPFPERSTDIDVVLDLMIHDIDLMLAIVKSELVSVSASGVAVLTDTPDIANARFEFADGCVANVTSSRISVSTTRKFRIFAKDQYVSLDLAAGEYARYRRDPAIKELTQAISHEFGETNVQDALLEEVRDFVNAVRENRPPLVQGKDGLKAQEVAEKVRKDIQQRLEVRAQL